MEERGGVVIILTFEGSWDGRKVNLICSMFRVC